MKLTLYTMLLLLALLATDAQADWVDTGHDNKDAADASMKHLVDMVKRRTGPLSLLNKRSVNWRAMLGRAGNVLANALVSKLDLACAQLTHLQRDKQGLTADDLKAAFGQTDENKDGRLNKAELGVFENVVGTLQHCLEVLKKVRPAQGM